MKPQIGQQIGARDQPKKLIVVHHYGDATAIENLQQVIDFRFWCERFELVGHRIFHRIVKVRRITVHLHEHIGFIKNSNGAPALIDNGQLRNIRVAHALECGEQRVCRSD